jgi:hypothetical protein
MMQVTFGEAPVRSGLRQGRSWYMENQARQ